jgi:dihydrolipoamide dehydrogenase
MKKFDVIVIGTGGGSKITSPAATLGYKVAVIEKDKLGGTCLNRGCIPSKMLIHPADVALEIKNASRFDIHNEPKFSVNFDKLITRISQTVDHDSEKIEASYTKHPNITYFHGSAKFVSPKVIEVNGEHLTAEKIFIAVGTRPQIPDIPGLAGTPFMTSTEALRNTKLPKVMVIIGGGYIATEIGHAYGAFGTETHFLVRSKLLRPEDAQVSEEFTRIFTKHHNIYLNAVPTRIHYHEHLFTVTYQQDGWEENILCDALLVATGVVSNADTLALERTGIKMDDHHFIQVDDNLRTNVDGIYAMGDCIGRYFFRHSVNFEGEYLFNEVFGHKTGRPIKYPPVPHAIFTHPQVAAVGKTEEELKKENIDYVVGLNPYRSSAMGMALLSDHGFCKLLIERQTRKILGCHIVGDEASNMIHMVIAFMNKEGTLDDLLNMIYIHPALPEIVRNSARKAKSELEKK